MLLPKKRRPMLGNVNLHKKKPIQGHCVSIRRLGKGSIKRRLFPFLSLSYSHNSKILVIGIPFFFPTLPKIDLVIRMLISWATLSLFYRDKCTPIQPGIPTKQTMDLFELWAYHLAPSIERQPTTIRSSLVKNVIIG